MYLKQYKRDGEKQKLLSTVTCSGGSKGGRRGRAPPPGGPNSFNFMQFLGKIDKFVCWRPPRGVGAPSSGKSWIRHWHVNHLKLHKPHSVYMWSRLMWIALQSECNQPWHVTFAASGNFHSQYVIFAGWKQDQLKLPKYWNSCYSTNHIGLV